VIATTVDWALRHFEERNTSPHLIRGAARGFGSLIRYGMNPSVLSDIQARRLHRQSVTSSRSPPFTVRPLLG
jgi:hypothetical protein